MGTKNKVRYGLKNCYYSKITYSDDDTISYETPKPLKGAKSISVSPVGDSEIVYADNEEYYINTENNGYEGDLELMQMPDDFKTDILGESLDETDGVRTENATTKYSEFALLFEFDGDVKARRHCFYRCTCSRLKIEGKTTEDKKEFATETLSIKALPRNDNKNVKVSTTSTTTEIVYNAWYSKVYEKENA